MIEIKEDKFEKAYEHVEKALKSMGKVMQCFSEWEEESMMGHREGGYGQRGGGSYGNRGGYGSRYGGGSMGQRGSMGNRDDDDWDEEEEMMMRERRGVRGSGRGR